MAAPLNTGTGAQPAPPAEPEKETPRSWIWTALKVCLAAAVLGVVLGAAGIWLCIKKYEAGLPSAETLRSSYRPPQVTRVLARDGTVLSQVFTERRTVVAFDSIPAHTKLSFLAAEDARFYEHEGLNYVGMLRAIVKNLRAGHTVQGGSTITQQVVKNLWLSPDRTFARKIRETILARRLEQSLSKDEILGLYLNHIYLGHGRYGVEEAARYYFGKHASELDLSESAALAGLVAAPERFSPRRDMNRALERRRFVLMQMRAKGFASPELVKEAVSAPIRLAPAADEESDLAPEAVAWALHLLETIEGEAANRGGYTIHTTIDPKLQAAARTAVRNDLEEYAKRQHREPPYLAKHKRLNWGPPATGHPKRFHIYVGRVQAVDDSSGTLTVSVGDITGVVKLAREDRFNPKQLTPSHFAELGALLRVQVTGDPESERPELRLDLGPQSALVAIDVRTRQILALVGSCEAVSGGLDRATHARRQPGSAFKAFVYSYAMHSRKFTAASVLELPPDPKHGVAEPRHMRLREALAKSDNFAAEKLFEMVGPSAVVQWAHAAGIESPLAPTPSLALGAYEVTPLELTNAYATFASGGTYEPPVIVSAIDGPSGRNVPLPAAPSPRVVMTNAEAFITTSLLKSVVESGTAQRARRLGRPVAGKTGTTNASRDAWFVGYSPEIVAGVWVGYDDGLTLGSSEAGATAALPGWIEFMKAAQEHRPVVDFPRPNEIEIARIDPESGLLAYDDQPNGFDEVFLAGTAPTERAMPDQDAGPPGSDLENARPAASAAPSAQTLEEIPPANERAAANP
jgi:penicillin-binding protein 1A